MQRLALLDQLQKASRLESIEEKLVKSLKSCGNDKGCHVSCPQGLPAAPGGADFELILRESWSQWT